MKQMMIAKKDKILLQKVQPIQVLFQTRLNLQNNHKAPSTHQGLIEDVIEADIATKRLKLLRDILALSLCLTLIRSCSGLSPPLNRINMGSERGWFFFFCDNSVGDSWWPLSCLTLTRSCDGLSSFLSSDQQGIQRGCKPPSLLPPVLVLFPMRPLCW
jgi:hypothetical protein